MRKSLANFARPRGADLLKRAAPFSQWRSARLEHRAWPYSRTLCSAPKETSVSLDENGEATEGYNFASQDYLSLSSHPDVLAAAERSIYSHGIHSAGSPVLLGNSQPSNLLEVELGDFLQMSHTLLFPTGWAAGFGTITGLMRPKDHIVMDELSHACLQQGAAASGARIHRHLHLCLDSVRAKLAEIRRGDSRGAILVVTEGLFSMDSDVPQIEGLQAACHEFGATLLVDVAHDLGAMGPGGTGSLGNQGMLGKVDLVMGSFSKTFASNGGFLACNSPEAHQFVKYMAGPHMFSNALSPLQAEVVRHCLKIIQSSEGHHLRKKLMDAIHALREAFGQAGVACLGSPSPIVPVPIGTEREARMLSAKLGNHGVNANLVEFPAVPRGAARFRMQVMANHTIADAKHAAARFMNAWEQVKSDSRVTS